MNSHGLTKENLDAAFPAALRQAPSAAALGETAAEELAARLEEIDRLRIYPRLDGLEEDLLDILAWDFKVDWWDPNYSLEEKRRTLRDSFLVHRRLGTRWAVETALGGIFPGAAVREWFTYGGKPYCFRVTLPAPETGLTAGKQSRVLRRVWYYKNLRSHLDALELLGETTGTVYTGIFAELGAVLEIWPGLAENVEATAPVGLGAAGAAAETLEVWPGLAQKAEGTAPVAASGIGRQETAVRLWPGAKERAEARCGAGGAYMEVNQIIEIYPEE